MTAADTYARALLSAVEDNPGRGGELLKNLRSLLARRGHEKLLPRIYQASVRLLRSKERSARYKEASPEQERTRALLELYRRLIKTH